MNSDNYDTHEESFEPYAAAMARHDSQLAAAVAASNPPSEAFEELREEQRQLLAKEEEAYYAREVNDYVPETKSLAETSGEKYRRISKDKDTRIVKAAKSAAKKSVKQKKIKRLPFFFSKK
jgi:hypothetical protein